MSEIFACLSLHKSARVIGTVLFILTSHNWKYNPKGKQNLPKASKKPVVEPELLMLLLVQCAVYASVRVPSYRVAAWCGFLWCVGVSQSSAATFPMFLLQQGCFAMLWVEYRVCTQWTRIENSILKILMGKSKYFFVAYMVCRCQKKHKSTAIVLSLNCLILTSLSKESGGYWA